MSSQVLDNSLTFPVDKEHGALRIVVVVSFIVIWIIGFFIINVTVPNEGLSLLAVLVGFGIAYAITAAIESILKRRWPSGREVEVTRDAVKLSKKGSLQTEMASEDTVSVLLWSFKISKRTRVPKGWSMLACALEYEKQYLTVYTFLSPAQLESYELADQFKKLVSSRKNANQLEAREDLRLAGEQRRLRDAENYRWLDGAEMASDDFITYVNRIRAQFPEWQLSN